jgi:hypothetical protein
MSRRIEARRAEARAIATRIATRPLRSESCVCGGTISVPLEQLSNYGYIGGAVQTHQQSIEHRRWVGRMNMRAQGPSFDVFVRAR